MRHRQNHRTRTYRNNTKEKRQRSLSQHPRRNRPLYRTKSHQHTTQPQRSNTNRRSHRSKPQAISQQHKTRLRHQRPPSKKRSPQLRISQRRSLPRPSSIISPRQATPPPTKPTSLLQPRPRQEPPQASHTTFTTNRKPQVQQTSHQDTLFTQLHIRQRNPTNSTTKSNLRLPRSNSPQDRRRSKRPFKATFTSQRTQQQATQATHTPRTNVTQRQAMRRETRRTSPTNRALQEPTNTAHKTNHATKRKPQVRTLNTTNRPQKISPPTSTNTKQVANYCVSIGCSTKAARWESYCMLLVQVPVHGDCSGTRGPYNKQQKVPLQSSSIRSQDQKLQDQCNMRHQANPQRTPQALFTSSTQHRSKQSRQVRSNPTTPNTTQGNHHTSRLLRNRERQKQRNHKTRRQDQQLCHRTFLHTQDTNPHTLHTTPRHATKKPRRNSHIQETTRKPHPRGLRHKQGTTNPSGGEIQSAHPTTFRPQRGLFTQKSATSNLRQQNGHTKPRRQHRCRTTTARGQHLQESRHGASKL